MPSLDPPRFIANARLPRWLLPAQWPAADGEVALALLELEDRRIGTIAPMRDDLPLPPLAGWNIHGALALPCFVDAHTHLDKAFTAARLGAVQPGLPGGIAATAADRGRWTPADVHARASRALDWAWHAGTRQLRTHINWWRPDEAPVAWQVLDALKDEWADRIALEKVALCPLAFFEEAAQARAIVRRIAAGGSGAVVGAFVHSSGWNPDALRNLLLSAQALGLDVDLHVDEELAPEARGVETTARILREIGFAGRVVCSHACALAAQTPARALATLDAVARVPITIVSLPMANLLLQDAAQDRTPRLRGITLVKEAAARGIPLLFASDSVQDAFCRLGSLDPVETLSAATMAAQLGDPFDAWSQSLCRADWLQPAPRPRPVLAGEPADLVLFVDADPIGWPSRGAARVVLRQGVHAAGTVPPSWLQAGGASSMRRHASTISCRSQRKPSSAS
ncbi:amidohydrolase family protein [Variovorax sp. PBL-E5]|uniref:amidohydrolase family protein n=1 Tax=Variovorax sp. PBL-E5 TaxID=434014 RepID=UPI001318BFC0|nr:Cytosine deaminase [Variovorax sp. PBL-E5]